MMSLLSFMPAPADLSAVVLSVVAEGYKARGGRRQFGVCSGRVVTEVVKQLETGRDGPPPREPPELVGVPLEAPTRTHHHPGRRRLVGELPAVLTGETHPALVIR